MAICERCGKCFEPIEPKLDSLCDDCVNEIISDRAKECPIDEDESINILTNVQTCLNSGSPVQNLLESPGATLALAKLTSVVGDDKHMLALNSFRIGAYLAFEQTKLDKLVTN